MVKIVHLGMLLVALGGCSRVGAPSTVPPVANAGDASSSRAASSSYKTLFSFNGTDGSEPVANLTYLNGVLYGTTMRGGKYGQGTVFSLSTSGTQQVLHDFKGVSSGDGQWPEGGLVVVGGKLYGTTFGGGNGGCGGGSEAGCGAVFEISTAGKERLIYKCGVCEFPNAGLTVVGGALYGTSTEYHGGNIYTSTTSGDAHELYRLKGYPDDGGTPHAPLVAVNDDAMYGTTVLGGSKKYGAIYSITTAGAESLVYSFGSLPDGRFPEAGMIQLSGVLYGTTQNGGSGTCNDKHPRKSHLGCGTIFEFSPSGSEKVLYSFAGKSDGALPLGGLVAVKDALYGTTSSAGANGSGGTVFRVTQSGKETVLHSFGAGTDGADPSAAMINVKGTLYGTTASGGTYGNGTVFALTP